MKHYNNLLMYALLVGGGLLAYFLIPSVRSLGWLGLIILVCPLMHILMMKDMRHNDKNH